MDPIARMVAAGAAGAGGSSATYVDDVFSTFLWDGTWDGTGSAVTINNGIDLTGEGGLVWTKHRNYANSHQLFDTERGAGFPLYSNITNREGSNHVFSSFNSNGFSLTAGSANLDALNGGTSQEYASWTFRKAPGFFDVVTYTGNGSAGHTISHSLGSVPGMIVIKNTSTEEQWQVWHRSVTGNLELDNTGGANTSSVRVNSVTSTSFDITSGWNTSNANGQTYVAYIFAHDDQSFGTDSDESIIKCGNFSTDSNGHFDVDLGWEPQWLMYKRIDSAGSHWYMLDVMRGWTADTITWLHADGNTTELAYTYQLRPYERGFKSQTNPIHGSNQNWIYMAIRRPHKPPTAGTEVFAVDFDSASSTIPTWDSGFPVDMAFALDTLGGGGAQKNSARLLGSNYLITSSTTAEASDGSLVWDSNNGWGKDYDVNRDYISWMFKRAPGFFDVVAYTGTGSARTITHNLNATPSVVLIKGRDTTFSWYWQHYALGANTWVQLNNDETKAANGSLFNSTLPTSSVFSVGSLAGNNGSGNDYIAYLFGDLDGISKAGTYTGTGANYGNSVDVDCGFTAGARFVLIKRTDSGGDWYVWDSTRGIVSGNDPYLLLNTSGAQVTNTDYIDPLNAGFTVTSSSGALNTLNATYLFLAIA